MFNHKIGLLLCFVVCMLTGCNEPPQSLGTVVVFTDHEDGGFTLVSDPGTADSVVVADVPASSCEPLNGGRFHCEVEVPKGFYGIDAYNVDGFYKPTSTFFDVCELATFQFWYREDSHQLP